VGRVSRLVAVQIKGVNCVQRTFHLPGKPGQCSVCSFYVGVDEIALKHNRANACACDAGFRFEAVYRLILRLIVMLILFFLATLVVA